MVWLPPNNTADGEGWVKALLSDLAGWPDSAAELLEAVWDVRSGRIAEWSMNYNVYGVKLQSGGAQVKFVDESCLVTFELLAAVVGKHLRL